MVMPNEVAMASTLVVLRKQSVGSAASQRESVVCLASKQACSRPPLTGLASAASAADPGISHGAPKHHTSLLHVNVRHTCQLSAQ